LFEVFKPKISLNFVALPIAQYNKFDLILKKNHFYPNSYSKFYIHKLPLKHFTLKINTDW